MFNAPRLVAALWALVCAASATAAPAPEACVRGIDLDPAYCDNNKDLVADTAADPAHQRSPSTLVFSCTPVEDPSVYEQLFKPFADYLGRCTARRVVFFQAHSNAGEIEAMRAGRLHVAGFSTGPTAFAVNTAGAVPFAVKGNAAGFQGYQLLAIVQRDSPAQKLGDLKGRRVVHTSPSSNSGHMAALALFPKEGLVPERDYKIRFFGKHNQSILGVKSGEYDAAAVASDAGPTMKPGVFERMLHRDEIRDGDFRILYRSPRFPTSSFAYAHDLEPALRERLVCWFLQYRFTPELSRGFKGADRFVPIGYEHDYALVREVAGAVGGRLNRPAHEPEGARFAR